MGRLIYLRQIVTDLVLLVLRILRRDLSKLAGSIELVDLYNKGQPSHVINSVRGSVDLQERHVPTYLRTLRTQSLLQGGVVYLRTLGLYQIVSLLRSNSQNIIRVNLLGIHSIVIDLIYIISIYIPSPFIGPPQYPYQAS